MIRRLTMILLSSGMLLIAGGLLASAMPVSAHEDDPHGDDVPTYYPDIQPIVETKCMACHTDGGIGPVSFDNPNVFAFGGEIVAYAVESGYMPPWMPGPDSPAMLGDRSMTAEEIELFVEWIEHGAPLGNADDAVVIEEAVYEPLREDVVLTMPEYEPDPALGDDYRCFLLDADLPEDRYITGYTVVPGDEAIVHHVLVYQVDETARAQAIARDAEDERPGWECFGGPGVDTGGRGRISEGGGIAGSIGAWAPGATPVRHPDGTGALLRADGLVVMQVHYHLDNGTSPDQTSVVMELAEPDAEITPLYALNMVAPVEIPCAPGNDSPLCDRGTMLAQEISEDGMRALGRAQGLLRLCDATPDDFASQDAGSVVSTCDYTVPQDAWAVGATGHMHELGTAFNLTRNPDGDDAQILLDIPVWDFHWQGAYQYVEPIWLNAGDTIRMTCEWDNSEGDRYVVWGEGTEDEMCLGALSLIPAE